MSSDAASNRESERRLVDAICNGGAGAEQAEERLLFELCHPAFSWLAAKEERDDANAAYNDLLVATHTHLSANSWRRLRKWTGESPLEAWLWVVIENLQKSLWRKTNRRRTREVGVADPAQFHDDAEHADVRVDADLDARVTGEKIVGAIAALDEPPYRSVVGCRLLLQMSGAETAALLGREAATVHTQYARAIQKLRDDLPKVDRARVQERMATTDRETQAFLDEIFDANATWGRIIEAVLKLNETVRFVVAFRLLLRLSAAEVSRCLGSEESRVNEDYTTGLRLLRDALKGAGHD